MRFSFLTAGIKILSNVEIDNLASNQHEFNGVSQLRRVFGQLRNEYITNFIYVNNNGCIIRDSGRLTWYNSREAHPTRNEFRLYYTENNVIRNAQIGDLLLVGLQEDDTVIVMIAEEGSEYYQFLITVFGGEINNSRFSIQNQVNI